VREVGRPLGEPQAQVDELGQVAAAEQVVQSRGVQPIEGSRRRTVGGGRTGVLTQAGERAGEQEVRVPGRRREVDRLAQRSDGVGVLAQRGPGPAQHDVRRGEQLVEDVLRVEGQLDDGQEQLLLGAEEVADEAGVHPGLLGDPAHRRTRVAALRELPAGSISNPIPVPGGFSIIAVQDTRKILTPDPRDAVLSLKQISIAFPKGTSRAEAEPIVGRFAEASKTIGGCGGAEKIATEFHGEVVTSDQVKMRDLPAALQRLMLPMQVGQATQPFGSLEEGVRVLVICGRDEVDQSAPSYDDVYNQLNEERVNSRARRYLRDLRRDAVIEFR